MLRLLGRPWAFRRVLGMAGGGAPSVGPYDDIPSIVAAYGMRRLLTSYTGALVRLRRASDNAESDFGYDANGDLDTAAIATWLTATTGYVATWYDQSGGGKNATQSTAASQPLYVASGQNSKPVLRFDGSNDRLPISTSFASLPMSLLAVAKRNSGTSEGVILGDSNSVSYFLAFGNGSQVSLRTTSGTASGAYSTGNTILATALIPSSGSTELYKNGTLLGGATAGTMIVRQIGSGNISPLNGDIAEAVIAGTWSTGERQAAEVAANTYWSIY